jgi:hypothetical protein
MSTTTSGTYLKLVRASGYSYHPLIYPTYLDIGCQRIRRVDLEQLAKEQGWELPKVG